MHMCARAHLGVSLSRVRVTPLGGSMLLFLVGSMLLHLVWFMCVRGIFTIFRLVFGNVPTV